MANSAKILALPGKAGPGAIEEERVFSRRSVALPLSEQRILLMLGDAAAFASAFALAYAVMPSSLQLPAFQGVNVLWCAGLCFVWTVLAAVNDCYSVRRCCRALATIKNVLLTSAQAGILLIGAFFLLTNRTTAEILWPFSWLTGWAPPRFVPMFIIGCGTFLVLLWRYLFLRLFTGAILCRRAIIVGAGCAGQITAKALQQPFSGYEIVGFVDDDPLKQDQVIQDRPVLGTRFDLQRIVLEAGIDEVILAITHQMHDDLFRVLMACYERGITIKPMHLLIEEALGKIPVAHMGKYWFAGICWNQMNLPTLHRVIKRGMDIVLSSFALVLLLPLFPLIYLLIVLDSPGPVFYEQERVGRGGRVFKVFKLRSMIHNAERDKVAVWATRNDPRITRVGRFLRCTRLDEAPQFWNILNGEMSIVGPRPERPEFINQLHESIPFYRTRLSVKPGLTGWAQIKYRYGNSTEDALKKLEYDLYYIKNQSVLLDLFIILRTVRVVLGFKGM